MTGFVSKKLVCGKIFDVGYSNKLVPKGKKLYSCFVYSINIVNIGMFFFI
jgi:hypothetical protein